jgi:hypothetical protein
MKQKQRQSTRIRLAFVYITGCSVLLILLFTIWLCIDHCRKAAAARRQFPSSISYSTEVISDSLSFMEQIGLLSFNAKKNGDAVYITWSTVAEKNNYYFTIERSEDGKYFRELGKIKSQSKGSSIKEYLFTDSSVSSVKTFYRLKQTGYDGSESECRTIAVVSSQKHRYPEN